MNPIRAQATKQSGLRVGLTIAVFIGCVVGIFAIGGYYADDHPTVFNLVTSVGGALALIFVIPNVAAWLLLGRPW